MNRINNILKKAAPIFLSLTLFLVTASVPEIKADTIQFSDVPATHWAKSAIVSAVSKGYVNGYPGAIFMPNANINRAEFIKMIVTAIGQPVETATGEWYESYVTAAQVAKLYTTSDFENSETEWNKKITRKEMARISARATGFTTKEDDKWMYLATKAGLITGLGTGRLGEEESTTRAQSVAIIERILTIKSGGTIKPDKYAVSNAELAWHGTNIFTVMPEVFTTGDPVKDINAADLWKEKEMTIVSIDGLYSAKLDALIAIDLADKNDPNLKIIPKLSTLKWKNNTDGTNNGISVTKTMDSYLLYSKSHLIYNKNPKIYHSEDPFYAALNGPYNPDYKSFLNGNLNQSTRVFQKYWDDTPMTILPKSGWKQDGQMLISIFTPAGGFYNTYNHILQINGPFFKGD